MREKRREECPEQAGVGEKEKGKEASIADKLRNTPILKRAIREIASDDEWDFALGEFFDGDLEGVGFAV